MQAVLGTRNMSGTELQKVYDWVEIFGFEDDAALLIVQHCIEKKGARVHINYMDSVAKRLVSEGRTTADSVAESFSMENDLASGAAAILKRWRNSRLPTEDELELYKKWTTQWGFSDEAIEIACRDVVAIDKPNFKYLDAILGKYHENGSVSPEKMRELLREQDMLAELARRIDIFGMAGVNDIIVDPGFGFAKTVEQNYRLLRDLEAFHVFERPLLVGVSRKSMIYRTFGTTPDEALNGTTVINTIALMARASVLRVHDAKEAAEAVKIVELTYNDKTWLHLE